MSFTSVLDSLAESTAALPALADAVGALDDAALIAYQTRLAEARRRIDAAVAVSSGEMHRRSARELGYAGLAQRLGARTAEKLVQRVSGVSKREAAVLVSVGSRLSDESPVSAAVSGGVISVEAADIIRTGLGEPSERVPGEALAQPTAQLLREAPGLTLDELASQARQLRDALDEAGVSDREAALRERRYLKLSPQWDGMVRLSGLLDPESAALITDAFDAVISPRRGPRFVDPSEKARAAEVVADPRSNEQLRVDALVSMVQLAGDADPGTLFGRHRPSVRVLVADASGFGHLEGSTAAVSIDTVQRHICDAGILPIVVGESLELGRTQRLFSARQRIALAVRDGGCRFPDCDKPPSWCEAHHIIPWSRGGRTDTADGVLLCRHHHLLVHNNAWSISRTGAEYLAHPPAGAPPKPMPSRSAVWREMTGQPEMTG